MDEKILELISLYVVKQDSFFNNDNVEDEISKFLTNNNSYINELISLKSEILELMNNDSELFKKYLKLGISISIEDYKLSELYKNEIIDYEKKI